MALICLGISGGMTLNHIDEMGSLLHFQAGASTLSQSAGDVVPDACLACQWENSLFSLQVPAISLDPQPLTPLPLLLVAARTRFPYPFDHTSPRAPPRLIS